MALVEAAGGAVLKKKPAWFDDRSGIGSDGGATASTVVVPFHAQKCRTAKRVSYFVIEENEATETEERRVLRVFRRRPQLGFATKAWLLDCFDRFEIVDADGFEEGDEEEEVDGDALEVLRRRQAARVSRSKDDGSEYLMAL